MEKEKSEFLEKISRLENSLKEAKTNASNIASNEAGKSARSITQQNHVISGLWMLDIFWPFKLDIDMSYWTEKKKICFQFLGPEGLQLLDRKSFS